MHAMELTISGIGLLHYLVRGSVSFIVCHCVVLKTSWLTSF